MAARALRRNLVAFSEKMDKELGWEAEYSLEEIIASAWKWHRGNVKEIQSLPLNEYQREAEWPICINQSVLKSNLLNQ
jgi:dTDP-D-glucose 4,6-dehydratase